MKKYLLIIVAAVLFITANAQSENHNNIPSNVTSAFAAKYPGSRVKQWIFANNVYKVKYRFSNKNHTAYFSPDGKWLKNETSYTFTYSLPAAVKNGLKHTAFASYYYDKITDVDSVGNHYYYFLAQTYPPSPDIDHDFFKIYKLYFSPEGKLIKKINIPVD